MIWRSRKSGFRLASRVSARAALRLLHARDVREVVALGRVEQERVRELVPATGVAEDGDLALLLEAIPALLEDGVAHLPQDLAALLHEVRAPEEIVIGAA